MNTDIVPTVALSLGAAWASGINLYAAVFMLGYMGATGNIDLPPHLQYLSDPLVLGAAGFMYCLEFFADKIPGIDTVWDSIHSFVRIPAGAALAAGAVGDVQPAMEAAAALVGGGLAAGSHLTKAGTRVVINTSPEPVSNWTASITEDLMVIGGLWTALNHPWLFLFALLIFIVLMVWLLPKLWRAFKRVLCYIGSLFGWCDPKKYTAPATPTTVPSRPAPEPGDKPNG